MSFISKVFYAGTDIVAAIFILFMATPVPWYDMVAFFMLGRAFMTMAGASLTPYTMESKVFYGGGDWLLGLFCVTNAYALGGPAGNIGTFLILRGTLTWLNIEI